MAASIEYHGRWNSHGVGYGNGPQGSTAKAATLGAALLYSSTRGIVSMGTKSIAPSLHASTASGTLPQSAFSMTGESCWRDVHTLSWFKLAGL